MSFAKDLMLWGSPSVIRAWCDFRTGAEAGGNPMAFEEAASSAS